MKLSSLYRVELLRLLRAPLTWLLAGLSLLAPLAGYQGLALTMGDSMSALYLANPLLAGGLLSAASFALLMLTALDKPRRSGMGALSDAIVAPLPLAAIRLAAVLTVAILTAVAVFILYLPYTVWKLDLVFSLSDYALAVALFFLSGPILGALAASALWQLTRRLDASLLAVLAALAASMSSYGRESYLAQWSVPLVSTLSDAFGSAIVWRTALYSRLVWLCLLGGAWLLSWLCLRQYGLGLLRSFFKHARRVAAPLLALALLALGAWLWQSQPFSDHSPANWLELMDTQADRSNPALVLEKTELQVSINSYLLGTMSGRADYAIHNTSGQEQQLYFELNAGYRVRSVLVNGESIPFDHSRGDMLASRELCCTLPAEEQIELQIDYGGMPKMWNALEYQLRADVISRQSVTLTGKTLSPALSGCVTVSENAPVSLSIDLKSSLTPVGTGAAARVANNDDGAASWLIEDQGTERLFLYAGDFVSARLDAGDGTKLDFYYSRKYQRRLENGALALMEQAIQYCTATIGPRASSEAFKIVQTSAFNFGGFAVSGISGMGESYFSDENLSDPDKGPDAAEVLAHEIIHQWWGLSATLLDEEDAAWNDEGITVYTTYRLMCRVAGQEYADAHYVKKWESTMSDLAASFYQRHPEYLEVLPERYQSSIRSTAAGANWYDGNALLIYRAAERIGLTQMDAVWAGLYQRSSGDQAELPYITMHDFLTACGLTEGDVGRE